MMEKRHKPCFSEDPLEYLWDQPTLVRAWAEHRSFIMNSPALLDLLDRNPDALPQVFAAMPLIRATGRIPRHLDPLCSAVCDQPVRPLAIPPKPPRPADLGSYLSTRPDLAKLFDEHRTFLVQHSELLQAMESDLALAACVLRNVERFRRLSKAPKCLRFVLSQPLLLSAIKRDPFLLDAEELWDKHICLDEFKEILENVKTWEKIRRMVTPADPEYYGVQAGWTLLELLRTIFPPIRVIIRRIALSPLRALFYIFMWLCRVLFLRGRVFALHKLAILCPADSGSRLHRFLLRQRPRVLVCMPFNVHAANLAYRTVIKPVVERHLRGKCVRISHPVDGDWRTHVRLHMLYSHISIIDVSFNNPNVADEREYFRILDHNLAMKKGKVLVGFDSDQGRDDLDDTESVFEYHHEYLPWLADSFQKHIESILQDLGFRRGFLDPWVLYPDPNPQFPTLEEALAFERSWIRTEHADHPNMLLKSFRTDFGLTRR